MKFCAPLLPNFGALCGPDTLRNSRHGLIISWNNTFLFTLLSSVYIDMKILDYVRGT
jgi:hypothetical protein